MKSFMWSQGKAFLSAQNKKHAGLLQKPGHESSRLSACKLGVRAEEASGLPTGSAAGFRGCHSLPASHQHFPEAAPGAGEPLSGQPGGDPPTVGTRDV